MGCPDETDISEFVARTIPATVAARIEAHIADCTDCRNLVFALASSDATGDEPAATARIGRFAIEAVLGRGAMGVVYRARDPELDRPVAIKVRSARAKLDVEGEDRLRREAQALARLAHPNVVSVFETGREGDVSYVVMELVEGTTLDVWLQTKPADVLAVLVGAGRGLAAAHGAGLVHRDFKPKNVFVATADRVAKVGDFGLVRAEHAEAVGPVGDLMMTLSVSGSIIGTPAYMSPEQLRGERATEASDQFSYCVTLFEALHGARPFRGNTVEELVAAMREPLAIPRGPAARALRRGLDPVPERRWPSMAALLAELAPKQTRTRWVVGGVLAGAASLAIASFAIAGDDPADECTIGPVAERTFADRRAELTTAFTATKARNAESTAERVATAFGEYGARWRSASIASCRATAQRRQSVKLGDLQRACLDRRLSEASELATVLGAVKDPAVVGQAMSAVLGLSAVEACTRTDENLLADREPPPPAQAAAVKDIEAKLDAVGSLYKTGQVKPAGEQIDAIVAAARATKYSPLVARALLVQAVVYTGNSRFKELEAILDEAAREAAKARDDRAAAEAWTRRVYAVGVQFARYDDAHQWARAADAAVLRAGNPPDLRSGLHMNVGTLLIEQGKLDEARVELEAALRLRTEHMPHAKILIGDVHNNLAALLQRQGKMDDAEAQFERALAIYRGVHGDEHPDVFETLINMGFLFTERDMPAKALEYLARARTLGEAVLGPHHINVGIAIDTMGLANVGLGKYDEAAALHAQAYEVMLAAVGPKHPRTGFALGNLARARQRLGDYPRAIEAYRDSAAILRESLGPTHAIVARVQVGLGTLLSITGDSKAAQREMTEALAIFAKNGHAESEDASLARVNLAQMALQQRRYAEARAGFEAAHAALLKSSGATSPHTLVAQAGIVYCDAVQRRFDKPRLDALEHALASANEIEPHIQGFLDFARARAYAAAQNKPRARELVASAALAYDKAKLPTSRDTVETWRDKELR